jgi:hypothetical protein
LGIDGGINFTADLADQLPLPLINAEQEKKLKSWVDKILFLTQSDNYMQNQAKHSHVHEYE